jgi:hypothetical protein
MPNKSLEKDNFTSEALSIFIRREKMSFII